MEIDKLIKSIPETIEVKGEMEEGRISPSEVTEQIDTPHGSIEFKVKIKKDSKAQVVIECTLLWVYDKDGVIAFLTIAKDNQIEDILNQRVKAIFQSHAQ